MTQRAVQRHVCIRGIKGTDKFKGDRSIPYDLITLDKYVSSHSLVLLLKDLTYTSLVPVTACS